MAGWTLKDSFTSQIAFNGQAIQQSYDALQIEFRWQQVGDVILLPSQLDAMRSNDVLQAEGRCFSTKLYFDVFCSHHSGRVSVVFTFILLLLS